MTDKVDKKNALDHEKETHANKVEGIAPLVNARKKDLESKVQAKRRQRYRPTINRMNKLGLNDEIGEYGTSEVGRLNGMLLAHFAHMAARNHQNDEIQLELVESLIAKGADINCRAINGQRVLHEVAGDWNTDVAQYLINHGAVVNIADDYGITPLHVAAAADYPEMIDLLIDNGANIEAKTKEDHTPLHFAARNDAVDSARALVMKGAVKEARDYKKRTPLLLAAVLGRSDVAKYLIDIKADVTVVDRNGQFCLTYLIMNSESAARLALDQYHKQDQVNREEFFRLHKLEVSEIQEHQDKFRDDITQMQENKTHAQTPLEVIVRYRKTDLIMHPVIKKLVKVKWECFGRKIGYQKLLCNVFFVLIWTILGVGHPWNLRPFYSFPQDAWRIIFLLAGCLLTVYEIYKEVREMIRSRRRFKTWKKERLKDIDLDLKDCNPKWPKEKKYYETQKDVLYKMLPTYFQDVWNMFDWVVFILVLVVVIVHIADASLPASLRHAPCCTVDFVCNDTSIAVCNTGIVNNANLSAWTNRFFVLLIIFLWLRIMKFTRAFRFLGPFMVMLEELMKDILRFLYLYGEFYIPYACGFWMIFGGIESISSMTTVDRMLFTLFRITLVDEYQYEEMHAYDVVMAYILIGTFLGISAILCLNLFIALLSYTFVRVYEKAKANAVMQRAASILTYEENLPKIAKEQFQRDLKEMFDDEVLHDDYSTYETEEDEVKKMTLEMKSQLEELTEVVRGLESLIKSQRPNPASASKKQQKPRKDKKKYLETFKMMPIFEPPVVKTEANTPLGAQRGRNDKIYEKINLHAMRQPNKVVPVNAEELTRTSSVSAITAQQVVGIYAPTNKSALTHDEETNPETVAGVRIADLPEHNNES